ncbi:MAG: hypothetical protein ACREBE_24910 [bacterium]
MARLTQPLSQAHIFEEQDTARQQAQCRCRGGPSKSRAKRCASRSSRRGPRRTRDQCAIDGAEETLCRLHLVAPARRRKIKRLESLACFSVQPPTDIRIDKVVFDRAQPRCHVIIDDAGFVEALGLLLGQLPEEVAAQFPIVGQEFARLSHG